MKENGQETVIFEKTASCLFFCDGDELKCEFLPDLDDRTHFR